MYCKSLEISNCKQLIVIHVSTNLYLFDKLNMLKPYLQGCNNIEKQTWLKEMLVSCFPE